MQWNEFSFRIRHFSAPDQRKIHRAFELGAKAHEGQLRQSGEPYFTHPIAVASILIDMGADADTLTAALLHDTVEDTFVTLQDINNEFGSTVSALVDGVTKLNEQEVGEFPNMNEQIETLRKMFTLMQTDVRIMVIKLIDRLHNMQTISFRKPAKQKTISKETLDVYVKIADRLCMRDTRDLLEELCRAVLEPDTHAHVQETRKKNEQRSVAEITYMESKLKESFKKVPYKDIHYERKTWDKLRLQYELEGAAVSGISGINIAFVCDSITDCYQTLGMLHQLWHREVLTFEDFINGPVINGYKGLHTTILLEDGMRIRCKIRTTEMDEYAHRGVTVSCFDSASKGVMDYLPWVSHISPLAEDTMRRSEKFWQSLQTDILGESIVVHGPSDESALIPRGATCLDAVLYLFRTEALKTEEILINGKPAEFYDEVPNASTITATFAPKPKVNVQWLQYVRTGVASAIIRQELIKLPQQDKEVLGREMLESSIRRVARIGLDELAPSVVQGQLHALQVTGMSDLLIQIAEGRLDAEHVARSMFRQKLDSSVRNEWVLTVNATATEDERSERVIRMYPFQKLNYKIQENMSLLKAKYSLTAKEVYQLQNALGTVLKPGQWSLIQSTTQQKLIIAMLSLVILWGLDPVFAHLLLSKEVDAFDLTIVRFITFFLASAAAYFAQRYVFKQKLKPLSPLHPPLILAGISLFITGAFTYITLAQIQATQYIVYIIAGLVLSNLVKNYRSGKEWVPLAVSFLLLVAGILTMTYVQNTSYIGSLSAVASSLGFALYTEVSRRYQQEVTTIQARYPAFMFWVSGICLILSMGMIPFLDTTAPSLLQLVQMVAFALIFAVLPYVLFFETSRRTSSRFLDNALPFVFISTILGELVMFGDATSIISAPVLLIFLWLYLSKKQTDAQ